jgi:2-oxopent-4-enoate/cis-2-oxohex-4-enoate hydratase
MKTEDIQKYGDELYNALITRTTVPPLLGRAEGITIEDAYRIQERMVSHRLKAGEKIVGKKIGVTSKVVQDMIGVKQPDFGQLTSGMHFEEGVDLPKRDLKGPGITATDVIRATDYVVPCFEIVDSRITDWKIKIQDTVADNASCGVYMLGKAKKTLTDLDLNLAGMVLEINGELFSTAAGAAVQGGPVNAVVWLANTLGALGIPFLAGEVILSGSQSMLIPAKVGDTFKCTVGGLGSCTVRFSGAEK